MRVLVIKTSSLGDVIHTLPALTDASQAIPTIHFDWVVEEVFTEIPRWHPSVGKVIPVALRRWRNQLFKAWQSGEWKIFRQLLASESYDYVIDAQGLIKSACVSFFAKGLSCGFDRHSARESLASLAYRYKYSVIKRQHAVSRLRQLFALVLGYTQPIGIPDYGIDLTRLGSPVDADNYLVFLHGTTWPTKHWPENYWQSLACYVTQAGYCVRLPWGNTVEYERAKRIATVSSQITILPQLKLSELAGVLAGAKGVVAVDTGLGHLAAALKVPTLSLYGPTDPKLTGTMGINQVHLAAQFTCAPCLQKICTYAKRPDEVEPACFGTLPPELVWRKLQEML